MAKDVITVPSPFERDKSERLVAVKDDKISPFATQQMLVN